jgi:AcrR family transcriptional regulator
MGKDQNPVGKRRRRRSDAALNRTKIVGAALHLLATDPDATMIEIAAEAGVGRGTAYRHFPSRDELVQAVRRQERDDKEANELEFVRPPGEVAHSAPTPMSITDVLNKVPPFQLGDQIIAEAQRLAGVTTAAIYLCDLDGTTLQRMAGGGGFPDRLAVPLAVGPEIPREGVEALRASIEEVLPGVAVAPMYLRGRATGVLIAIGARDDALRDLAAEAAAAIALADEYTDAIASVRRVRPTSPAAEIQQNLLPPRILRIAGALVAGNVLPGYDIGGDWFDYAENRDCAWIGIADTEGEGPAAAGLGAVLLGAFRSARHGTSDPGAAVRAMHDVLREVSRGKATAHVTIATWNGATSTIRWVTCGEHAPIVITP